MGHSIKRKEDPRFIRGQGNYVDDVKLPGMLYMDIVRSPYAHAKIKKIDTERGAQGDPGVLAVITGEDLEKYNLHWMPTLMSTRRWCCRRQGDVPGAGSRRGDRHRPLHRRRRRRGGRGRVRAAAGVVDPFKALEPGAPVLRTDKKDKKDNHIFTGKRATRRPPTRRSPSADVTVKQHIYIPRIHVASIETCGCVADFDKVTGQAHRLHDHAGAARDPHGVALSPARRPVEEDPRHLARHRRRLRQQGAGLSRLRRDRGRARS
jgi:carbon-monoxide dehydrogenase large subunit